MKRKDWICPMCGAVMHITESGRYVTCPTGHLRLQSRHGVRDLPFATRVDYKRFMIDGERGCWEYVCRAHHGCMGRVPAEDTIVAKVPYGRAQDYRRAMVFKPTTLPRRKRL